MMRCSLTSPEPMSGLPGAAAPVAGSIRRMEPFSRRASPAGRRGLWLRSAPPSAVGLVSGVPTGKGGSPQGLAGVGLPSASAELAPVGVVEAGAVAAADVEIAVLAEVERAGRVARELLAPVVDERRLAGRPVRADGGQAAEAAADHAAVGRGAGRRWTGVGRLACHAPLGGRAADHGVEGVEDVDVVVRREVGVDRQPQQAAVPEVIDLRAQVGDDGVGVGREVREELDQAALLGDQHAAVRKEAHDGRVRQAGEDGALGKARLLVARDRHRGRSPGEQNGGDAGPASAGFPHRETQPPAFLLARLIGTSL